MAMTSEEQKTLLRQVLGDLVGATFANEAGTFMLPPDHVLLDVRPDTYGATTLDALVDMFGAALPEEMPVADHGAGLYASLVALDPEDTMGWHQHFERWRDEGRLG